MPIDVKDFEEKGTEPAGKQSGQVRPQVEKFLAENDGQAYTTREIADATGANKATVNHTVRKLQEEEKVERKTVDGHIYNRWVGGELTEEDEEEEE